MKHQTLFGVLGLWIGIVGVAPATAELMAIDVVPAATLLLPNFVVDIGDANGDGWADCVDSGHLTTLMSINNARPEATLAHVTVWTDWSIASLDFDIYLTGFDVQTINFCDMFGLGRLPVTASAGQDPTDKISPKGSASQDINFASCSGFFPFKQDILKGAFLDRIQNAHAGYQVPGFAGCMSQGLNGSGQCAGGVCPGGTIARGYVTVDAVRSCSLLFAGETGYFVDGGLGVATDQNVLWGDYFVVDPVANYAQGEPLVHIEADPELDSALIPLLDPNTGATAALVANATGYTFYGRYVAQAGVLTGDDNREPLGTVWGARYLNGGDFAGGSSYVVWRDSTAKVTDHNQTHACGLCGVGGAGPSWCPLNETQVVCFDEAEAAVQVCSSSSTVSPPAPDTACFPLETNRVKVGAKPLDPPFSFGWCYLNLNVGFDAPVGDVDFGTNGAIAQSFVSVSHDASGRFSVGLQAVELSSAAQDVNPVLVVP